MKIISKKLSAEQRKAVTVESVIALAAKHNPSEITTAAIAKHMDLTQGALFRHFINKEAIWRAVMEWVNKRLMERINKAVDGAENSIKALEAMFDTHIRFIAAHPGVPRILFGELQRAESSPAKKLVHQTLQNYGKLIAQIVEQGKEENLVDVQIDSQVAAVMFIGCIQGLVMQSMLAGEFANIHQKSTGVFKLFLLSIEKKS